MRSDVIPGATFHDYQLPDQDGNARRLSALADFTMISGFDVDITAAVPDGALVEIDPDAAVLRVLADA